MPPPLSEDLIEKAVCPVSAGWNGAWSLALYPPSRAPCLERGATVYGVRPLRPDLALGNLASGVYGNRHRFVAFHRLFGVAPWRRKDVRNLSLASALVLVLYMFSYI